MDFARNVYQVLLDVLTISSCIFPSLYKYDIPNFCEIFYVLLLPRVFSSGLDDWITFLVWLFNTLFFTVSEGGYLGGARGLWPTRRYRLNIYIHSSLLKSKNSKLELRNRLRKWINAWVSGARVRGRIEWGVGIVEKARQNNFRVLGRWKRGFIVRSGWNRVGSIKWCDQL